MKIPCSLFLLAACVGGTPACKSPRPQKSSSSSEDRGPARPGEISPGAETGSYYRLKGSMTGFYYQIPKYTDVLPNRFLMRGHIVQLLDPDAGDGWARVKNEDFQVGYVQFENIKIVPFEDQPKPKVRDPDAELDQNMRLE